jgi:hypothetical protein
MARLHSCNVLQAGAGARQLWQFAADGGKFALTREQASPADHPLPAGVVAKTWRSLFQPKLNVAWLPPENVFLRVAQFPRSSFEETLAMVELQLEKLSPIPVTQVTWSIHVLPHDAGDLQTVIVILAERKAVEEFLGQLEGQGYLADRIEIPALDQLQATVVKEDGAWIYPGASGGQNSALVAWWCGGVLQNLNFISLPPTGDRAASLREQLTQTAWASEMDGWLTSAPAWHLVADSVAATEWEPVLRQAFNEPVAVTAPLPAAALAALTAKRAATAAPKSNLLPAEFAARYQQQFVDRLWMRGLLAAGAVYGLAVLIYLGAAQYLAIQTRNVEDRVKAIGPDYTNALQLKAQFDVLKERQDLKFAGLDCWRTVAELMPDTFKLENMTFGDGKKLVLRGTAPAAEVTQLYDFHDKMRKALVDGKPLFDVAKGNQTPPYSLIPGGAEMSWNFELELKHVEAE